MFQRFDTENAVNLVGKEGRLPRLFQIQADIGVPVEVNPGILDVFEHRSQGRLVTTDIEDGFSETSRKFLKNKPASVDASGKCFNDKSFD